MISLKLEQVEPFIEESYNTLLEVDPLAKACVPVYVEVFFTSADYGPTFHDSQRIMLNIMYRFDKVWEASYETNAAFYQLVYNRTSSDGTTPLTAGDVS